jgi:hypothetical protein
MTFLVLSVFPAPDSPLQCVGTKAMAIDMGDARYEYTLVLPFLAHVDPCSLGNCKYMRGILVPSFTAVLLDDRIGIQSFASFLVLALVRLEQVCACCRCGLGQREREGHGHGQGEPAGSAYAGVGVLGLRLGSSTYAGAAPPSPSMMDVDSGSGGGAGTGNGNICIPRPRLRRSRARSGTELVCVCLSGFVHKRDDSWRWRLEWSAACSSSCIPRTTASIVCVEGRASACASSSAGRSSTSMGIRTGARSCSTAGSRDVSRSRSGEACKLQRESVSLVVSTKK